MPNKTKQNTKNSTEQICSQPLYKSQTTHHTHPHPNHTKPRQAMRATTTTMADANTVLNVNPTVCLLAKNSYAQPKTHPHPPPTNSDKHMRAQENNPTQPNRPCRTVPHKTGLPRKEVIQPHLPVRLPCYDFTPLTNHTFGVSLLKG